MSTSSIAQHRVTSKNDQFNSTLVGHITNDLSLHIANFPKSVVNVLSSDSTNK